MSTIGYCWWLGTQALGLLVGWWPLTIALLVAVFTSSRMAEYHRDPQLRSLPTMLFMFPVLILVWGSVAGIDAAGPAWPLWRFAVLALIIVLQTVVSAALIYIARGARWPTAWFSALLAWITTVCAYLSGLAVAGQMPPPT